MAHYISPTGVQPTTTFQYGPMLGRHGGPLPRQLPPGFAPPAPPSVRGTGRTKAKSSPRTGATPAKRKKAKGKRKVAKKRRGKAVKCKNVTVCGSRRKLCWDRKGKLVSNKPAGRKRKKARKKKR